MSDPAKIDTNPNPDKRLLTDSFAALCRSRAMRYGAGELTGQDAIDWLYDWAFTRNLIDAIGDDAVQAIIAYAFLPYREKEAS